MKIHKLTCPVCSTDVEIQPNRRCYSCPYCGTKIYLDDGTKHEEITKNTTYSTIHPGEAKIKGTRIEALWKVPVYCAVSSWISFYLTVYLGGFFFTVKTAGADGVTQVSADPVRSAIFQAVLFLLVLLVGGLWAFRSMSKTEIAASAGIASATYLLIVLAQLSIPNFPLSLSITLAYIQNWTGILSSFLLKLTDNLTLSVILSSFAPLLFIPFGRKPAP